MLTSTPTVQLGNSRFVTWLNASPSVYPGGVAMVSMNELLICCGVPARPVPPREPTRLTLGRASSLRRLPVPWMLQYLFELLEGQGYCLPRARQACREIE